MSITLILGPMGSGKSAQLLIYAKREELAKKKVLYISHPDSGSTVKSRNGNSKDCVGFLTEDTDAFQAIIIDEGQFFDNGDELVNYAEKQANKGKKIFIAALDADFKRENFGNIHKIFPKAETIKKLKAVCYHCGNDASFSQRLNKENTKQKDTDKTHYEAVCRQCYFNN